MSSEKEKKKTTKKNTDVAEVKKPAAESGRTRKKSDAKPAAETRDKSDRDGRPPRRGYADALPSDGMIHQFMPYILGVAVVFLAACFIFSKFDGAMGVVGTSLRNFFCGLLGWPAFLLPLIILNLAIYWRRYVDRGLVGWKLVLSFITIALVAALVHVFYVRGAFAPDYSWGEYWSSVRGANGFDSNWALGKAIQGGGFLGGFFGGFFRCTVGFIGSIILLIALIIVSVMFLFSVTPGYVVTSVKYRVMKSREKRAERNEKRREAAREDDRRRREETEKLERKAQEAAEKAPQKKREREFFADAVITDSPDGKIAETPKYVGTIETGRPAAEAGTAKPVALNSDPGGSGEFVITGKTQPDDAVTAGTPAEPTPEDVKGLQSTYAVLDEIFGTGKKRGKAEAAKEADKPETAPAAKKTPAETAAKKTPAGKSGTPSVVMTKMTDTDIVSEDQTDENTISDGVRGKGGQLSAYFFPPLDLLREPDKTEEEDYSAELRENAEQIMNKLTAFNVKIQKIEYSRGPTVTRYELYPEASTRVRSIASLADDISLVLASQIRLEAPIPNKNAVGIEVPNKIRRSVYIREMLESEKFKSLTGKLTVCLGKDIGGNMVFCDISKMPHLLIAGTTGSGKSVCMNAIIVSLLYRFRPSEVQFIMIDPKKVEMNMYNGLPYLKVPVVTDVKRAAATLTAAVAEMEYRYNLFEQENTRDIDGYNRLMSQDDPGFIPLPRIVVFIDELADLIMTGPQEIEDNIARLAQKARAAGIHLVIGTQRPTVNVITGLIKANVPTRIAFAVKSNQDSRVILDIPGAEKLIGSGDMLFAPIGMQKPSRIQGAFVDDSEVRAITQYIKDHSSAVQYDEEFISAVDREADRLESEGRQKKDQDEESAEFVQEADPLFKQALQIAVDNGTVATSLLQRKLSIGFGRAAKIIDRMENLSLISGANGTKPRNVLITRQDYMEMEMENDPRIEGRFV